MSELTDRQERIEVVWRRVDRPVWVVAAAHAGRRGGLAATWVTQCSLDPRTPQLLVGIAVNHFTRELIDGAGAFTAHLLRPDQTALCLNFAIGSGRERDKLHGVPHHLGEHGGPRLADCLAWLECRVFYRLLAGERVYYWADVLDGGPTRDDRSQVAGEKDRPLLESDLFAAASERDIAQLSANRLADIAAHAPLHQAWRRRLKTGQA